MYTKGAFKIIIVSGRRKVWSRFWVQEECHGKNMNETFSFNMSMFRVFRLKNFKDMETSISMHFSVNVLDHRSCIITLEAIVAGLHWWQYCKYVASKLGFCDAERTSCKRLTVEIISKIQYNDYRASWSLIQFVSTFHIAPQLEARISYVWQEYMHPFI